ncbi:hypothetical protein BCR35DRAFT_309710 [Leucosporidium creatinivorum]|uniref:F-box domain-containing protein n=1 Tax=Leucosporidium creatinivorum TaxID=106004 RepID=A0A1Y2DCW8_9BASI|nr:hypothetical protein BCR35DRAFT_309710 [Leucosporidium creatinivorum]
MAERVAKQLKAKGGKARRERVRSLNITIEEDKSTRRGNRLAALINACPLLEKLEMRSDEELTMGKGSTMSRALTVALSRLSNLEHFTYRGRHVFCHAVDFGALISSWPKLQTLVMPDCETKSFVERRAEDLVNLSSPIPLRRLELPLGGGSGENLDTITKIVNASRTTLRHLDLGSSREFNSSLSPAFTLSDLSAIASVAPQLHSFTSTSHIESQSLPPPHHYLSATLSALRDIRVLHLGLGGYDLTTLFPLLTPLPFLQVLSITVEHIGASIPEHAQERYRQISATDVIKFMEKAPELVQLTLPRAVRNLWEDCEVSGEVRMAAEDCGVRLRFAEKWSPSIFERF